MKIRIEANGEAGGTVVHTEAGEHITGHIEAVAFSHIGGGIPRVEVTLCQCPARLEGEGRFFVLDPRDGQRREVKRIEFADGGEFVPTGRA